MTENQETIATVEVDQEVSATPEAVWDALVTNEGLDLWMGEGSTINPVVDGALRVPDVVTGTPRSGRVDEMEHRERLDFSWWPDTDPLDVTHISIVLAPSEVGTLITVVESRPVSALASVGAIASWSWRCALLAVATTRARC